MMSQRVGEKVRERASERASKDYSTYLYVRNTDVFDSTSSRRA